MAFRFGEAFFDPETRELFRGGENVAISPKALRLIETLIERRPKAVSKRELQDALWPDTYVAEGSLARLVNEVRQAIGDSAEHPRFLRTVHRFGYAFSGPLAVEPRREAKTDRPQSVFKLVWGDREIALAEGENLLGRDPSSFVCIDAHSVSRHHARVVVSGDRATIEDLGSKNGTFLGNRRLTAPSPLKDGDEIRIGTVPMKVRRFAQGGTTETARSG